MLFRSLLITRPVAFFYESYSGPVAGASHYCPAKGCTGPSWSQEVLALGTPAIWWGSMLALLFCLGWWFIGLIGDLVFNRVPRRDWRAGAILLAVAVGWLPWIWFYLHDDRTEFFYYAVSFLPFLTIAITLCIGLIIGPARAAPSRRALGAVGVGAYLVGVLIMFWYFYAILAAEVIPYPDWLSHIWYKVAGHGKYYLDGIGWF